MSASIPESHKDLLEKPVFVTLGTVNANGQPQLSVIWCSFDGTHIWVNTIRGRLKEKNMAARPLVTILAIDPENSYRYLEVRGQVDEVTEEGAVDHIHQLSQMYVNQQYYGDFTPAERANEETRVIYKIRPTKVVAFGH